jgi:cell division protein FtsB
MLPLLFSVVCGYFGWHAMHGERGLIARDIRMKQIEEARAQLARAEAERDAIERRVAGLRGEQLDPDMLEERARALLNLVGRDEMVVPYGPDHRLF